MGSSGILLLLVLLALVLIVVAAIQRSTRTSTQAGGGSDIVAYLLMALAMGVAGFALAELVSSAFPSDRFVFDPAQDVATALASLVVSLPFAVFLWRRQAGRRARFPASSGWTLYLAVMEMVFLTAFTITAVYFVNGLFTDSSASAWTGMIVFGAIVVFHDWAARQTPPLSDSGELQRVIGSAIGLITGGLGLVGVLTAVFGSLSASWDFSFEPWAAMLVVGAPIWAYRWLRHWQSTPTLPRVSWLVVTTTGSLAAALGSLTWVLALILQYLLTDTASATTHFDPVPIPLAVAITGIPVWLVHRRSLGTERSDPVRFYEYLIAGIGLVAAAFSAIALTIVAFDRSVIVGGDSEDVVALATILVAGLVVWRLFTSLSARGAVEEEVTSWPARIYHLGLGIVFGLVAAGALITTLFIVLRRLLGEVAATSLLEPISILIYTGLVTWYLLAGFVRNRRLTESEEMVTPFEVTLITSHPGMIATRFPKQARLQVVYRSDDEGRVDDEMADAIVAEVANRPSIVWVDRDGFRVAPKTGSP